MGCYLFLLELLLEPEASTPDDELLLLGVTLVELDPRSPWLLDPALFSDPVPLLAPVVELVPLSADGPVCAAPELRDELLLSAAVPLGEERLWPDAVPVGEEPAWPDDEFD